MANAKPIPDGYHSLTPHMVVRDADRAIKYYKSAFGAEELSRQATPDGKVLHASLRIGDSIVMLNDEFPDWQCHGPESIGGSPVTIHLYVDDVDKVYQKAVDAGGTSTMPVSDTFWGDRYGKLRDPFGHEWSIATHKEDLTPQEIEKRAEAFFAGTAPAG